MQRVDTNDLDLETDDYQRLYHNGESFTGEVVEGSIEDPISLETYWDGWLNGPWRLWHLDGSPRAHGEFVKGRFIGEVLAGHENGRLQSRRSSRRQGRSCPPTSGTKTVGSPSPAWRTTTT
ncbi:toxin-antitoxin system YwqK family antitoxin [Kitasatospora sp. P5_F3]